MPEIAPPWSIGHRCCSLDGGRRAAARQRADRVPKLSKVHSGTNTECDDCMISLVLSISMGVEVGRLKNLPHTSRRCMLLMVGISAVAESKIAHVSTLHVLDSSSQEQSLSKLSSGGSRRRRHESFRSSGKERTRKSLRRARAFSATLERPTRLDGKRDERSPCTET